VVIINLFIFDQLSFPPSFTAAPAAAAYDDNVAAFATIETCPATMPLFSQNKLA
jgi:hypothetical protein